MSRAFTLGIAFVVGLAAAAFLAWIAGRQPERAQGGSDGEEVAFAQGERGLRTPATASARGAASGRLATPGSSVGFRVAVVDVAGNPIEGAVLFAQGSEVSVRREGAQHDVRGTLPLVLHAQAAGYADALLKSVAEPPPPETPLRLVLRREVTVTVRVGGPSRLDDRGYVWLRSPDGVSRDALEIRGGAGEARLPLPEGESQLWFVGERLIAGPRAVVVAEGALLELEASARPLGSVRVLGVRKGLEAPRLSMPLAPPEIALGDLLTPVARREASREEEGAFVFEGVPAGRVLAAASDAEGTRVATGAAVVVAGGVIELRIVE